MRRIRKLMKTAELQQEKSVLRSRRAGRRTTPLGWPWEGELRAEDWREFTVQYPELVTMEAWISHLDRCLKQMVESLTLEMLAKRQEQRRKERESQGSKGKS